MTKIIDITNRTFSWFKQIGQLRDGFLVGLGLLYIIGYLVWAFYAWKKNLGLLPALDFQYIIAGIAPALLLLILYFSIRLIILFRNKLSVWFGPEVTGIRHICRHVIFAAAGISFIIFLILDQDWLQINYPELSFRIQSISSTIMILSFFLLPPTRNFRLITLYRYYGLLIIIVCVIIVIVVGLFIFIEAIFPNIPQEFGGPKPRCAQLDVITTQLSDETLYAILPSNATINDTRVIRSNDVNVFFSNSEFLLVSPFVKNKGNNSEIYEIKRSNLEAIIWCGG